MVIRVCKKNRLGIVTILLLTPLVFLSCSASLSIYTKLPFERSEVAECVILIHGLGRTYRSMWDMEEKLREAGYHTVNVDYPSRKKTIEEIAGEYVPKAIEECQIYNAQAIHFVTHSLGGIITRKAMKDNRPELLGRVVMLSPPNKGSNIADALKGRWFYRWINGPAGQQLSTAADSLPNTLGPVDYPVGIITGNDPAFFDIWFTTFIPGINDGKIAVSQTRLDGMADFMVVSESHTYIMDADQVQDETVYFLKHGTFRHTDEQSEDKKP